MLSALKFVQGSIAKKDFVPALTHFRIKDGVVRGYNGRIALSSPINLDLDVTPKAVPFVKAIEACTTTIALSRSSNGKLYIKSGSFKAFVDCTEEEYPHIAPEGEYTPTDYPILSVLRKLEPFIAEDASRPWARGILFRGKSVFATNNIILVELWTGLSFPCEVVIPYTAVSEIIRLKQEPIAIQVSPTSLTFHFEGERWLRTQVYDLEWPDIGKVLNQEGNPVPIPKGFFEALLKLKPFLGEGERIYLREGQVSTSNEDAEGATIEVPDIRTTACFNHEQLSNLEGIATAIDFAGYPKPCLFRGEKLRGAIIGIRL